MVKRVLLIDDDFDEHDIFSSALKSYDSNITCITANSWLESSTLLQHFLPDVIFLDFNMPHVNGAQALQLIKKIPTLKNTKVYIYSTAENLNGYKEVLQLGAIKWIRKPKKIEDFNKIFEEVFSQ